MADSTVWHAQAADEHACDDFFTTECDAHAVAHTGVPLGSQPLCIEARDHDGTRLGVLEADMAWGGLSISRLLVASTARHRGVGSLLMRAALRVATAAGCRIACVETFEYQAPKFYPRHGFHLDFVREGFRGDHAFHYFSRALPGDLPDTVAAESSKHIPADNTAALTSESGPVDVLDAAGQSITLQRTAMTDDMNTWLRAAFREHALAVCGDHSRSFKWCFSVSDPSAPHAVLGAVRGKVFWGGCFVYAVAVRPELRRRGIGTALLRAVISLAKEHECQRVFAEAFDWDAPLTAFLLARGFVRDATRAGWRNGSSHSHFSLTI